MQYYLLLFSFLFSFKIFIFLKEHKGIKKKHDQVILSPYEIQINRRLGKPRNEMAFFPEEKKPQNDDVYSKYI